MSSEEAWVEKMTSEEIKAAAEKNMKPEVWDWVNGATETGLTFERNRWALERVCLKLRLLHGLQTANTRLNILGHEVETPIIVAPFANMVRVHPEAERAIALGAAKSGAMMFLGAVSTYSAEQVGEAASIPLVWMGEPFKDRARLVRLMHEAEKAGCCAVGICADDFMGIKIKDRLLPLQNSPLSKEEIREIRKETSLPFVLKGIMTKEDAVEAADAGVDAIVVSNHGGRVLDCGQASIEVLPEIVRAVGGKIEVLIDGGFRRGTDVLKALALGARGVLVGRPICWGLAAAGAEGVAHILQMMTSELERAMLLTNVPDVTNVSGQAAVVSVGFDIDSRVK